MNPKNWSAKAQSIALIVIPAILAALNAWQGWHLDPQLILGLFGLGAVGAASVAHIDNGEPAEGAPLAYGNFEKRASTAPVDLLGETEKTALRTLAPSIASKLGLCLVAALALSACAAPASEQGRASQGGTIDRAPIVNVTVTFSGDVKVDGTSAPTAAPSAASDAVNRQDARTDTSVPIDASGVIPAGGDGKVLGAVKTPKVPVVVVPEIVVPAPAPAPAPTVPETPAPVDAPVPPPLAPIGEVK